MEPVWSFAKYGEIIPLHNKNQKTKQFTQQTANDKKCKKRGGWVALLAKHHCSHVPRGNTSQDALRRL